MCHFCLAGLRVLFLSLVLRSLTVMFLGLVFYGLWSFLDTSTKLSSNLDIFRLYFKYFSAVFSLHAFGDIEYMSVTLLHIDHCDIFHFLKSFFLSIL